MRLALILSALSVSLIACSSPPETPKTSLPTVSEAPSLDERIVVCESTEDAASNAVNRCVTSDVDGEALAETLFRWGQALPLFGDGLFDTASFAQRYELKDGERECLRRAFCRPMPFEER